MIRSIRAVLFGILLAILIGVLVVFGIAAPILTRFFGLEVSSGSVLPAIFVAFAAAFAFYWGGMYASYKAPGRRRLHGVLVGVLSFAITPLANLVSGGGSDSFANLRTPETLSFTGVLFVMVFAASYIGARRGEALYAHNRAYQEQERRRRFREESSSQPKS